MHTECAKMLSELVKDKVSRDVEDFQKMASLTERQALYGELYSSMDASVYEKYGGKETECGAKLLHNMYSRHYERDELDEECDAFFNMTLPRSRKELKDNKFNEFKNKMLEVRYAVRPVKIINKLTDVVDVKTSIVVRVENMWDKSEKNQRAVTEIVEEVEAMVTRIKAGEDSMAGQSVKLYNRRCRCLHSVQSTV